MRGGRDRRLPLWRGAAVAVAALSSLVGAAACGGDADTDAPPPGVVRSTELVFRREAEERIVVVDADTDRVLRTLDAGEGGFLRGALRPLDRERERFEVSRDAPYILELRTDGALVLRDPPTGMDLDLAAFGPTSREHFLTLLDGREPPEHPTLSTPNRPMEDRP